MQENEKQADSSCLSSASSVACKVRRELEAAAKLSQLQAAEKV